MNCRLEALQVGNVGVAEFPSSEGPLTLLQAGGCGQRVQRIWEKLQSVSSAYIIATPRMMSLTRSGLDLWMCGAAHIAPISGVVVDNNDGVGGGLFETRCLQQAKVHQKSS